MTAMTAMDGSFPRAFGKYILLKPLARGGMGEIFLALSGEVGGFQKLCVIKKVHAADRSDSRVRRFLDECKVVVKLSHGNLVQVFDAGFVADEVYLAMEYVEGRDLRDLMVRSEQARLQIPTELALYCTMQICRGLDYAHTFGNLKLVHRDICPSNVLVSYFGEVKVTDFGLAHSVLKEEMTEPGKIYGRFSYLAPEQAGREEVDPRTDIYATGIILWELLVGQPMRPGPHSDPSTTLSLIRAGKVRAPSTKNRRISSELDGVVVRALQPQKEHRFSSAEQMRGALARILARLNPSFDAGGVASFIREIYREQVQETKEERERLLARDYAHLKRPTGPQKGVSLVDSSDVSADLTGQVVDGRYRIIRLLGEGGMGAVYEVEHMEIGRRMALKVLHAPYSNIPETMARFRHEARAASMIGHPNIVEVTDSGATENGRLFFVMELLSGVDLAQVMAESHIVPARRALRVTLQICKGLHAAHEAGVVHRDLKPENIFLIERDGRGDFVKILDFGIAKNIELAKPGDPRLTHPGMAMGTPEYMAPEQATGDHIDRRIDVYATGAMLYEMLTGHLPHEGETLMKVLSKKASEPPEPPRTFCPQMPEELQDVILCALASDPDQRYLDMARFAEALKPFTRPGACDWSERSRTPSADAFAATAPAVAVVEEGEARADSTEESLAPPFDMTYPLPGVDSAHLVQPGEVRLADNIVPLERRLVPLSDQEAGSGATELDMSPGPRSLIWLLAPAAAILLLLAGLAAWIWWPSEEALVPVRPDAMPVDLTVAPPDIVSPVAPDAKPPRPKLTPKEVDRLVEWTRSAIKGRRYIQPKGDNARELIERVQQDYPDHPAVERLRQLMRKRLARDVYLARRKRHYRAAENWISAWMELEPESSAPKAQLALVHLAQGQRALARRRFRLAVKHANLALEARPESPSSAFELLGDIDVKRRQYVDALKHYNAALKVSKISKRQTRRLKKKIQRVRRRIK